MILSSLSKDDKIIENKVEEKTALNFAIENENVNAVDLLLKNGKIDINFPSKLSIKPKEFDDEDDENEEEEEEEKKEKTQNVQGEDKEITPLQIATEKGNAQIINLIKSYKK